MSPFLKGSNSVFIWEIEGGLLLHNNGTNTRWERWQIALWNPISILLLTIFSIQTCVTTGLIYICTRIFQTLAQASQCNLDLISWKILPKTCCFKWLIRYDPVQWAELSDFRHPYLNTDSVGKQLTHYRGFYHLNKKWGSFCCFNNLFENSLAI